MHIMPVLIDSVTSTIGSHSSQTIFQPQIQQEYTNSNAPKWWKVSFLGSSHASHETEDVPVESSEDVLCAHPIAESKSDKPSLVSFSETQNMDGHQT